MITSFSSVISDRCYNKVPEFIICLDYKASTPFADWKFYVPGKVTNLSVSATSDLVTAMEQAEAQHDDSVYSVAIYKKIAKGPGRTVVYKKILVARDLGQWHRSVNVYGESEVDFLYTPESQIRPIHYGDLWACQFISGKTWASWQAQMAESNAALTD